ncbi:S1 family peptidase [Flavipsychrobacter stenotrophus]|nr:serine protease [Flavipsychrobacter stenotrophus]
MLKYLMIFAIIFTCTKETDAQSLGQERVKRIKSCTVRVVIEGSGSIGTAFFVNESGALLTCWHVIEPSIVQIGDRRSFKKIYIVYPKGDSEEVAIPTTFFDSKLNISAVAYDFCLLAIINPKNKKYPFLKMGVYDLANEGDDIYTCGYPLAIQQQFVSKGIISTKYINENNAIAISDGKVVTMPRHESLLDVTMNPGNSGGAIIKIGDTPDKDEVIGIADFIINPIAGIADELTSKFKGAAGLKIMGVDPNITFAGFTELFKTTSNGISGCISLNHVIDALK